MPVGDRSGRVVLLMPDIVEECGLEELSPADLRDLAHRDFEGDY